VSPSPRWGWAAAGWSLLFAALHLFWAAGGSLGLAESAGAGLAGERPAWFVGFGLYGVAVVLVAAAVLAVVLAGRAHGPRRQRVAIVLGTAVAGVLLLRALCMEVLLLAIPGYGHGAVSPAERFWTLVLWDPWFLVGGVAFAGVTVAARRRHPGAAP
jgi:hypothetical protein